MGLGTSVCMKIRVKGGRRWRALVTSASWVFPLPPDQRSEVQAGRLASAKPEHR